MKKINTIILCGIAEPWLKTLELLKKYLNIDPVYYIARSDDLPEKKLKQHFPDCFHQNMDDAWKGMGFPNYKIYPLDENILKSIAHEELIFLKMMDRLDPDGYSFSFTHRQYFFHDLLGIWLSIIDKKNINLIISPSIPHRGFDYALYIAAKIRGIEFIMFQMTPFLDSSYILDDIDHTPKYMKNISIEERMDDELRSDIVQKIQNVRNAYDDAKPDYMRKQDETKIAYYSLKNKALSFVKIILMQSYKLLDETNTYRIKKGMMPSDSKILNYQNIIDHKKWNEYKNRLQKNYSDLCSESISKPYVFVALHYQPEETSCPTGGTFVDQLLIVEMLDANLDENIEIIVKEHKTQFHPLWEGESGRSVYFYKRLSKISNRVKLVSIDKNPFELIDGAIATVTISGTVGWESIVRGTPALIFGRAWYEDMPGVYKIKSNEDLLSIWPKVIKDKNNISLKQITASHKNLQNFFINAPHYGAFIGKVERPVEISACNIYFGIKDHLVRKGWIF